MTRKRKHDSPEEKVAILKRHLLEKVPFSDLCDELGVNPTAFYRSRIFSGPFSRDFGNRWLQPHWFTRVGFSSCVRRGVAAARCRQFLFRPGIGCSMCDFVDTHCRGECDNNSGLVHLVDRPMDTLVRRS